MFATCKIVMKSYVEEEKQLDRSWNLWDVFGKQQHGCDTELSVAMRSQVRGEKKVALEKAPDRELSLVSVGTH